MFLKEHLTGKKKVHKNFLKELNFTLSRPKSYHQQRCKIAMYVWYLRTPIEPEFPMTVHTGLTKSDVKNSCSC